jgi:protein-S-isoprenylcysteine O-methyltransferase Ste14
MPHLTVAEIQQWTPRIFLLLAAVWLGSLPFVKPVARPTSRASNLPHRLVLIAGLYLLFAPSSPIFIPPALNLPLYAVTLPIALAGLAIVLAGLAFACWARFILGSSWSANPMIRQDHELILHGPYRIVRHPIYTGILTMFLGTAIQFGPLRSFLGVVLCAISFRIKLAVEEQLMLQQFGHQYVEYSAQVRRIVPFLY